MKYLALAVLVGFIAVGGFGFSGMDHDMSHGSGCIASVVNNNAVCPQEGISSALYHIVAYQGFSQATVASISLSAIALLMLLAALLAVRKKLHPIPVASSSQVLSRRRDDVLIPHRAKFLRRLSLFENSPSLHCSA